MDPEIFFSTPKPTLFFLHVGISSTMVQIGNVDETFPPGGLVLSDCYKYYLASQLVTARWLLCPNRYNTSTILEVGVLNSLEALQHLLFHGLKAPYPLTPSMVITFKVWKVGPVYEAIQHYTISPNAPLWCKSNFVIYFYILRDPQAWTKHKISLISHIANGSLRSFTSLSTDYNVLASHLFKYLQLSHAFVSQLPNISLRLNNLILST